MTMPWQPLKRNVFDLVINCRASITHQERTSCRATKEYGSQILKTVVNSLGEKKQRIFSYIATGAYVHESKKQSIDLGDGYCKHCGQQVQDASHLLWHCPVINSHRPKEHVSKAEQEQMNSTVMQGVPPALSRGLVGPYWDYEADETDVLGKDVF